MEKILENLLKNKHVNALEINLECVITFNHRFSVFNIFAAGQALISTSGHNKR